MKWFEHHTDAVANKKFKMLRRMYGEDCDHYMATYGRLWRLYEVVAGANSGLEGWKLPEDYGLDLLAIDLEMKDVDSLRALLDVFASMKLIDHKPWREEQQISIPNLGEYCGGYNRKVLSRKKKGLESGQDPDSVRTVSGQDPDNVPTMSGQDPDSSRTGSGQCPTEQNRTEQRTTPLGVVQFGASPLKGSAPSPRDPIVYESTYIDLRRSARDRLRAKYARGMSDEQFEEVLDRVDMYIGANPRRYKRHANGKVKDPGGIIRNWLGNEHARPTAPRPPTTVVPVRARATPDCPHCHGEGLVRGPDASDGRPAYARCKCVMENLRRAQTAAATH